MTTTKQLDQMWQGHTVVIGEPHEKFPFSGERFGLLNMLRLSEELNGLGVLGNDHHIVFVLVCLKAVLDKYFPES